MFSIKRDFFFILSLKAFLTIWMERKTHIHEIVENRNLGKNTVNLLHPISGRFMDFHTYFFNAFFPPTLSHMPRKFMYVALGFVFCKSLCQSCVFFFCARYLVCSS